VASDGDRQRDLAAVFRTVAGGPADVAPDQLLWMAVAGGLEAGPDVVGCSITEQDGSRYRTTAYAGEPSMALDLVQYRAGRGPCLAALCEQRSYLADDPAGLSRFVPGWAPAAERLGVATVLSLPLPGLLRGAGINFYGAAVASFALPEVRARAALVGRLAGQLLRQMEGRPAAGSTGAVPGAAGRGAEQQRALLARARAVISRAEGISSVQAFAWLAQRSLCEQRRIGAVARDALDDDRCLLDGRIHDEH
jgi:hypothetical protein